MIYLNDKTIQKLNVSWDNNIQVIIDSIECLRSNHTVQPVKPYLRYGDPKNRIIAMPAFVGGNINKAGIKWIASFPDNIHKGLTRAHSLIVLNEAETGIPTGVINSGSISAIRTASVSGFMIKQFVKQRKSKNLTIGIIGFGPIGQHHLAMCSQLLGDAIAEVLIYDKNPVKTELIPDEISAKVTIAESWQQAYSEADIFITCTVSSSRYIDQKPKDGSLHLNVSLRDYKTEAFPWFAGAIVVDNWEEICREQTDIEVFHQENGLQKADVKELQELTADFFDTLDPHQAVMFNPMGMAIFDIAMADNYLKLAQKADEGVLLEA